MKKIYRFTIPFLLINLILAACSSIGGSVSKAAISLTDGLGREVNLASPAEKIISLAPSNTEILFAIGAGGQLIGRDEFSDYPLEAGDLPSVGGSMGNYDMEKIASLQPDLVLAAVGIITPEQVQTLEKLGLTVFSIADPIDLAGLYANIGSVGKLTGHENEAASLVKSLKNRVDTVTSRLVDVTEKPLVYYELDASDLAKPWTPGPESFITMLIQLAGGRSVGESLTSSYAQISLEALLTQNPDIILVRSGTGSVSPEDVALRDGWQSIKAIQENQVFTIDENIISRPGPRLVDGLETLAKLLYPEIFK